MIAYLEKWIKDLVTILLFTSFIELLLPESRLEKYTQVVLGLFVVIAILNPILNLFNADYNFYQLSEVLTAASQPEVEMSEIKRDGQKLRRERQRQVVNKYRDRIARQVTALVAINQELTKEQVEVKLTDQQQIKQLIIKLDRKVTKDFQDSSDEIRVGEIEADSNSQAKLETVDTLKIKRRLANFYNLSTDQVIIKSD
ncbi:MAG: stage III sporulation protein AF [Bacillota bacterium]